MSLFNSCLYECRVYHRRYIRVDSKFRDRIFMFCLDLDELKALASRSPLLFGVNRWRPFAFYDRDHFKFLDKGGPQSTRERVNQYLAAQGISQAPARVMLLTNLRVFGYVFNPVSFYYCYDEQDQLLAVLAEVNNTYGEQKPYLVHADGQALELERREIKNFYVSPFIAHNTDFHFRFREPRDLVNVRIDSVRGPHRILKAILHGKRRSFSARALLAALLRYPLVTVRIIVMIHVRALFLYARGIYVHDKRESDQKILKLEREIHNKQKNKHSVEKERSVMSA